MVAGGAGPAGPVVSPTAGAWPGEGHVPEAVPVHDGLGVGDSGAVAGDPDPQGGRLYATAHRGVQLERLPVDPDRDLGGVGVNDHLAGGQAGQAPGAAPTQQPGRLGGALDGDREHPQGGPVQPGPAPEPGDVAHPVLVVGDQDRLGALDGHVLGPGHQPRPLMPGQQPWQLVQGGAGLVVAVGRALHDGGIGPEGGVVDERAAGDDPQVDAELDPVG